MKVKCPRCGFWDEGKFCSNCGAPLPQPKMEKPDVPEGVAWVDKCPVCKSGKLVEITKKRLFGLVKTEELECNNCGAKFVRHGDRYKLVWVEDTTHPVWQEYGNQTLTPREWKNIAYGGMSDAKQKELDMECWMTELREGKVPIHMGSEPPIILRRKENPILVLPNVVLWEPRSVRRITGGYAGPTFRIAKGVYFRVGGFRAVGESHEELKQIDEGVLTLTDRRLVFSGSKRTVNIDLRKIVAVEPYRDGIGVQRADRARTQYFTGIDQVELKIRVEDREYIEPLTGLIMKYMIEGLVKRMG